MTDEQQPWLPFDELNEEKHETVPELPHYENPQTDNERLLELQYQFKHGDQKALKKIYRLSYQISMKFINSQAKKNKHIRRLDYYDKLEKAHNAATYILEQYIKRDDFCITKNFPGYLFLRVQHELYYLREVDKLVDFVDLETLESLEDPGTSTWSATFRLRPTL